MSAHILSNQLKELGKRNKMRDLPGIYPFFRNEFNKLNNTRARMLHLHECSCFVEFIKEVWEKR